VLAGGSGTRFWPVSRRERPKQLLEINGKTLLASTFERVRRLGPPSNWWMVVGDDHAERCRATVPEVPVSHVLVEPARRNTASAIALAAVHIAESDPDAVMAVFPADHMVRDTKRLCDALERAARRAKDGAIVTLGITPTHPETGYGYIQRRGSANEVGGYGVARFVEKPDRQGAEALLSGQDVYWNAGIFVMRVDVFCHALAEHQPEIDAAMAKIVKSIGSNYEATLAACYEELPKISVDHGIMEFANNVEVVPVDCGWSDIGTWTAFAELFGVDDAGNRSQGRAVLLDSRDCIVHVGDGHAVATLGVRGLVVVHTKDATLVVSADRVQEVGKIVDALKERQWSEYL